MLQLQLPLSMVCTYLQPPISHFIKKKKINQTTHTHSLCDKIINESRPKKIIMKHLRLSHRQRRNRFISALCVILPSFVAWGFVILPSRFISRPISSHNSILSSSRTGTLFRMARNVPPYNYKNESQCESIENDSILFQAGLFLDDSAHEFQQTLRDTQHIQMDSIPCACEGDNITINDNDDLVREMFVSLVEKIRGYNPEAVEGIDTSTLLDHESVSLMDSVGDASDESSGMLLLRAYYYAKAAHNGQCRKSGEPYISKSLRLFTTSFIFI